MLNAILKFSLQQRMLVIAAALVLSGCGVWTAMTLPIDVFPDLDRPRVVIMTEASGLAPEEVESQVTFPIETAVNGANGVQAVRSTSSTGLSVINVEFEFGTNVFTARQIVNERLQMVSERLPTSINPQLAPISSVMGQILVLGMWSQNERLSPIDLRTEADWIVRQRLLSIPGVAQVFTMGGGRKQFQVQIDQVALVKYGITIDEVRQAVASSNENATGGYLNQRPNELLVRALGRIQSIDDLKSIAVANRSARPVSLSMVANIVEAAQTKRGDASAFIRQDDGQFSGGPAVVLTVSKQPGADTREITHEIELAIAEIQPSLSAGVRIEALYAQEHFIDRAIENVLEALRDGGVLVVIILFLFLMNFRTTFISLTAIPQVVSEVMQGQRTFDVVVRLQEDARENLDVLRRLPVELPGGGKVPLESVAKIYESFGPNTIQREKIRRRIVIQCNTADRGLVEVVEEIRTKLQTLSETLPPGYYFEFSGQFESQQQASRVISWLFVVALAGVFLTLFAMFRSVSLSLQVMAAIPMAFIGSVAAIAITGQTLTIASMVGFISLGGIASRNGILLLQHYMHLVKHEGEAFSHAMIIRAGQERLAPVLMTALTAGIGLVPLVLAAGQPGKEILNPVATVILGGVISSTLLDFFIHPALFWLFGARSIPSAEVI